MCVVKVCVYQMRKPQAHIKEYTQTHRFETHKIKSMSTHTNRLLIRRIWRLLLLQCVTNV